jgi:hypothetical protein
VDYRGPGPFTAHFSTAREDEVILYLCAAASGSGSPQVCSYSIDGTPGKNRLSVMCDGIFRLMKLAETPLKSGSHTLALTFPGSPGGAPSILLDTLVVQPVVEHRTLKTLNGRSITLVKSFSTTACKVSLKNSGYGPAANVTLLDNRGTLVNCNRGRQFNSTIMLPPYGYALIE